MSSPLNNKSLPLIVVALLVIVIGYYFLNAPDRRDPAEKIGDAIQELGNRTPGEKIKDAVTDGD